jgi:hypothetical protein
MNVSVNKAGNDELIGGQLNFLETSLVSMIPGSKLRLAADFYDLFVQLATFYRPNLHKHSTNLSVFHSNESIQDCFRILERQIVEEVPEKHFAIHDVFLGLKTAKSNRFDQNAITKTNKDSSETRTDSVVG